MNRFPLSPAYVCTLPHVLESVGVLWVPNPILESQQLQWFSLLEIMPILALVRVEPPHTTLKPSLLQLCCKDAVEPINFFHALRPSLVARYCPSAMSWHKECAALLMTMKWVLSLTFIPTQILENGALWYIGNLVSVKSNPVAPPSRL